MDYAILIANIRDLAAQKGESPNTSLLKSGAGKNFFSNLKSGSSPSAEKLFQLSEYFGVSIDYLLGRDDEPKKSQPADTGEPQSPVVQELDNIIDGLSTDEKEKLLQMVKIMGSLSADDMDKFYQMARLMFPDTK